MPRHASSSNNAALRHSRSVGAFALPAAVGANMAAAHPWRKPAASPAGMFFNMPSWPSFA